MSDSGMANGYGFGIIVTNYSFPPLAAGRGFGDTFKLFPLLVTDNN